MNDSEVLALKEWRRKRLLTQEELAAKVGVTFTTISNWETGEAPPRVRNIRKLARP
jgi:transcriptional regulator with XRE-family HTH domain